MPGEPAEEGRPGSAQLVRLVEHPARFLNAVLLVGLFCQLAQAAIVGRSGFSGGALRLANSSVQVLNPAATAALSTSSLGV